MATRRSLIIPSTLPRLPRVLWRSTSSSSSKLSLRISASIADLQLDSDNNAGKNKIEKKKKQKQKKIKSPGNAVYLLLLTNLGVFALDHWLQVNGIKQHLYLYHGSPRWYQFITSTVCHGSWSHLSSNLFFIYIFGKLVEEEEGGFGLWFAYILTGAGANLVSWLLLPTNIVSVGASGAVFGLFAISVLVKLTWDWRKMLEVLILGQFVLDKVVEATSLAQQQQASNVNHIAHCAGALIGVLLIWLITRIAPPGKEDEGSGV